MRRTRIGLPRTVLLAGVLAIFAVAPAGAGADPTTLFAAPEGKGEACTEEAPCTIQKAVAEAGDGDSVRLLREGLTAYPTGPSGLRISHEIDIGGLPGSPAIIHANYPVSELQVVEGAGARLHDIHFTGSSLQLESGAAERLYVNYPGPELAPQPVAACELGRNTTLTDSVCWANEATGTTAANGVETITADEGTHSTVTLRNVTAIAADAGGHGLFGLGGGGTHTTVDATNVVARADHAADVVANAVTVAYPELSIVLDHSNYGSTEVEVPRASVTPPGSATNQSAAPLFAAAAIGDFHEAEGSPTLDAGAPVPGEGPLDLDGAPRARPGCAGAVPTPDVGAYELNGTGPCPQPKPQPVNPGGPNRPVPVFRILKVATHGGSGAVQIEVPSAGMLSMTGSGIKLITRAAGGPGVIRVPLKPWAITLARLKRAGKTRVRLKVRFAALGVAPKELRRTVVLRRRGRG